MASVHTRGPYLYIVPSCARLTQNWQQYALAMMPQMRQALGVGLGFRRTSDVRSPMGPGINYCGLPLAELQLVRCKIKAGVINQVSRSNLKNLEY